MHSFSGDLDSSGWFYPLPPITASRTSKARKEIKETCLRFNSLIDWIRWSAVDLQEQSLCSAAWQKFWHNKSVLNMRKSCESERSGLTSEKKRIEFYHCICWEIRKRRGRVAWDHALHHLHNAGDSVFQCRWSYNQNEWIRVEDSYIIKQAYREESELGRKTLF